VAVWKETVPAEKPRRTTAKETAMSLPKATEKRMLTEDEFDVVQKTHYPALSALTREDLGETVRRIRTFRNKARDIAHQQRREMRGKGAPRGARPAQDNTGTSIKKQIFANALKRANRALERLEAAEDKPNQVVLARRALAMKRANRKQHQPDPGRTAHGSAQPNPSQRRTVDTDPREIGRVSDFVQRAQVHRDR
jgi:hypothetical protein